MATSPAQPPVAATNSSSPVTSPPPQSNAPPIMIVTSPPPSLSPPPVTLPPVTSPPPSLSPPPVTLPPVTSPPPSLSPPPVTLPPVTSPPGPPPTRSPSSVIISPTESPPPPVVSPPPPVNHSSPPPPSLQPPPPSVQPPTNPPPSPILVPSLPPPPASLPPPRPSPSGPTPPISQHSPPPSPPLDHSPPPPPAKSSPPLAPEETKPQPPSPPSTQPPTFSTPPLPPRSPTQILVPVPPSTNPPQNTPTLSPPPGTSNSTNTSGAINIGAVIGITATVAVLLIITLIGLLLWCLRKREKRLSAVSGSYLTPMSSSTQRSDAAFVAGKYSSSDSTYYYSQSQSSGLGNSKGLFSYEELGKATNSFSQENLLGEGGFGCVYKGILPDGRVVAVKQLKIGGGQGDREFKNEVETLSRIHHRHLVSIVGHCISGDHRLLIYDYVSNNDLYFHLHTSKEVLDWATRVKIAAGAARGLAYLHEDCHPRIIHRDIKSSNILLQDNFDARVSDFGLARLALDCNTHITTRVMGTFGYMAPEYASSGKLTEKSDVFSFGVVLLELISGRKPVDSSQPIGEESLVEWARPLVSHAIENEEFDSLADPKLEGKYVGSEMFRMVEAAGACVRHSAAKRPRMGQIVRAFESLAGEDLTNGMRLGESEVYNSAQQSAELKLFRRMAFGSQNYSTDFFTHSSYGSRDEKV